MDDGCQITKAMKRVRGRERNQEPQRSSKKEKTKEEENGFKFEMTGRMWRWS
jgi:hypothetical protein